MYGDLSAASEDPTGGAYRGGVGNGVKELQGQKDAMYSFCREIREIRHKSLLAALEKTTVGPGKEIELIKTYGLPLKDFGGLGSRLALDKLRAGPMHGERKIPEKSFNCLF